MFTSSSFYEDANSTYPTVEEQVFDCNSKNKFDSYEFEISTAVGLDVIPVGEGFLSCKWRTATNFLPRPIQVGMARKIAESLSSDSNAQSKGANMFFRRVKRSHKWVHQGELSVEGVEIEIINHQILVIHLYRVP